MRGRLAPGSNGTENTLRGESRHMPAKQFFVKLSALEYDTLQTMLKGGTASARSLNRARILLKADEGWNDEDIAQALNVSVRTCERVRQRFARHGLQAALNHKEQLRRKQPKLDGAAEARLIALACSKPPEGRTHWTMELLADDLVRLKVVDAISDETVRQVLKKNRSQALAQRGVVPAQGSRCRLRLQYGGRAGPLPAALRRKTPAGLHG